MKIEKDAVATIDYTLTGADGEVLDSSREEGGEPVVYLHGTGTIVPGLEAALAGKQAGDSVTVTLAPEEAYGDRDESRVMKVDKTQFPQDQSVDVGMQFHAQSDDGHHTLTVLAVEGDEVTVDANHPLAGQTLAFDVKVVEVRQATEEELSHGHAHGHEGHHH